MSLKVLIVDDDLIVLYLHRIVLEDCNIAQNPMTAEHGKEAIEMLLSDPDFDKTNYLIFLDINMPVMGGWEFLEVIQNTPLNEKVFVVMVTSSLDAKDYKKAITYSQVVSFLEKPLSEQVCVPLKSVEALSHFFTK